MTLASPFMAASRDGQAGTVARDAPRLNNGIVLIGRDGSRRAEHRQGQRDALAGFLEEFAGQGRATAAVRAGTRAHRQLSHAGATGFGGFADLAVGHAIADADITWAVGPWTGRHHIANGE